MELTNAYELLLTRRSCKSFLDTPLDQETIEKIITAGRYAANGRGLQSPVFVAVTNKDTLAALSQRNASVMGLEGIDPFYGAPCAVLVFADTTAHTWKEDGSLAIGNMLVAAHFLGVGACWIHRCFQMFATPEGKELLTQWKVADIDKLSGVGICILGYQKDLPKPQAPRLEHKVYHIF